MTIATQDAVTIIRAHRTLEGEGFEVRRAIPSRAVPAVGPFIFLDHLGPTDYGPGEAKGAPTHPHAGLETLTYLLEGRGWHLDSLGNSGAMRPGEVQWMCAGRGILHDEGADEEFQRTGGRMHGVQLWINMPRGRRHEAPAYRHVRADAIPRLDHAGGYTKLIAGSLAGHHGPIATFAEPWLAHVHLAAGRETRLALPGVSEIGVYLMAGRARVAGTAVRDGELAVLPAGSVEVRLAADAPMDAIVLGGPPLDAPVIFHGPFVMNTKDEIHQAIHDFQTGKFGAIVKPSRSRLV